MTSRPANSSNPPFRTPRPDELQSQESRASTYEQRSQEERSETGVIDDRSVENKTPHEAPTPERFEDIDRLSDRHLLNLDGPPG